MSESNITIQLPKTKVSPEFIEVLDEIFLSHGLKPCQLVTVTPLDPAAGYHLEWNHIGKKLGSIKGFLIEYAGGTALPPWTSPTGESFPTFSLSIKVYLHFSKEMVCDKIFMHAHAGPRSHYSAEEKADALTVQDITLQLHKNFNAIDSCAMGENEEAPWFHFSKDEWKTVGDLPVRGDD